MTQREWKVPLPVALLILAFALPTLYKSATNPERPPEQVEKTLMFEVAEEARSHPAPDRAVLVRGKVDDWLRVNPGWELRGEPQEQQEGRFLVMVRKKKPE